MIRLSDAYVQVSSIMPQKRNPVSLEHSRALASAVLGETQVVWGMLSNTPFGDIVDKEQELQRHLWAALDRAKQLYRLLTVVFHGMEINRDLLRQRAMESYAVVTQLAESIVQETGQSFRIAHRIVSKVVKQATSQGWKVTEIGAELVNRVGAEVVGFPLELSEEQVREALDAWRFIELRDRVGGPAPRVMCEQIEQRQKKLETDEQWVDQQWEYLEKREELLRMRVKDLLAAELPDC